MRLEITIPDQLYDRAQSAASARGLTIERYMTTALKTQLLGETADSEALKLSPEQAEFIRKGQAEVKAGKYLTAEQVRDELAANRAAWRESTQK